MRKNRTELFVAVCRKVKIAEYHLENLCRQLERYPKADPPRSNMPHHSVQAHFEGVLQSSYTVVDLLKGNLGMSAEVERRMQTDKEKTLYKDFIEVRRCATHYFYKKEPDSATGEWEVQRNGSDYCGSRELREYCRAVVNLVRKVAKSRSEVGAKC